MFKHLPVTEPDDLAVFRNYVRRSFIAGGFMLVVALVLIFAFPVRQMNFFGLRLALFFVAFIALSATTRPLRFRRAYEAMGFNPHTKPALPYPLSLGFVLAPGTLMVSFLPISFSTTTSSWGLVGVLLSVTMMFAGGALALHGWRARNPSEPCCQRCSYPIDPASLPAECPECGKAASNINHLTRTPIVRRPRLIACGVPLFLLGATLFQLVMFKPSGMYAVMPRPALLAAAASNRDAFAKVDTTSLSPGERDRLIDGVLDARLDGWSFQTSDQLEWIGSLLSAGALSPEQTERYLLGDARLEIRSRVYTERSVEIALFADIPKTGHRTILHLYFFGGFEFDPVPPGLAGIHPVDRTSTSRRASTLREDYPERDRAQGRDPNGAGDEDGPRVIFTPDAETNVRARLIFAAFDRADHTKRSITWHADGSYTITPQPLAIYERTAETVIQPRP